MIWGATGRSGRGSHSGKEGMALFSGRGAGTPVVIVTRCSLEGLREKKKIDYKALPLHSHNSIGKPIGRKNPYQGIQSNSQNRQCVYPLTSKAQ